MLRRTGAVILETIQERSRKRKRRCTQRRLLDITSTDAEEKQSRGGPERRTRAMGIRATSINNSIIRPGLFDWGVSQNGRHLPLPTLGDSLPRPSLGVGLEGLRAEKLE
ncbi:hypothetical protein SKAU_G00326190 [Synaphobranchus kaupii]|uniref:Uncharacterized protein n=1 Tax=Synaphobranchus kaupii TaxID=118154 RepID=A0A9Q1IK97_SYNKA|nr:hypothetical protein SKAU_G00326190 [Synaphobranchus kaupii]